MEFKDPKLEFLADMSVGLDMYDIAEINNGYKCAGIQHYLIDKGQRIPKGQSKMDNPEKLAAQGTLDEDKQNKKHNTICVGHHNTQTNTNNVNKM